MTHEVPGRFDAVLARTVELLNQELEPEQLISLGKASAVIRWEFPDVALQTWLVVEREPPGIFLRPIGPGNPSLTVNMDSTVLHQAATGERSLGAAFLAGRLHVRGLNPMFLAKFAKLIDPLLRSYRAAIKELHDLAA